MVGDSNTVYSDVFTEFNFETDTDFLLRDQTERVFGEFSTFQTQSCLLRQRIPVEHQK